MRRRSFRWIAAFILWSTFGALFALPGLSSPTWSRALVGSLAQWWSWGLVAPLVFLIDRLLPFNEEQLGKRIAVHLPVSVALTLVRFYVAAAMSSIFGLGTWRVLARAGFLSATFLPALLWSWLVYWIIFGVQQIFRYYQHYLASELRLARMERSSSEARLNALRMQLHPHFVFNALNTISSQVERDPRLARTMIEHLGDLLRLSLEGRDRQEVPLEEEVAFLGHYVAIQKIRFAENLLIEIQVTPEVNCALVPCLILQPLVENAIRHGISRRASGGSVTVTAGRGGNQVEIRVSDDGVGLPPGWVLEQASGTGLSVTRERILGLYPTGNSRFSVRPRAGGGTEVEISLPLRFAEEPANATAR